MNKKTIGIILIVIAVLNMIVGIPDAFNGKAEGALYYIFIIAIFLVGFNLVADYRNKEKAELSSYKKERSEQRLRRNQREQILSETTTAMISQKYHLLVDTIINSYSGNRIWQDTIKSLS